MPLAETLEAFDALVRSGDIRYWGVSNFDTADMEELAALPGGAAVATNQVLYNLGRRGIEFDLLPWCRERRIPIMAYSPIEQGRLLENAVVRRVAARRGVTPAQVALAWVARARGRAGDPERQPPRSRAAVPCRARRPARPGGSAAISTAGSHRRGARRRSRCSDRNDRVDSVVSREAGSGFETAMVRLKPDATRRLRN